MDIIYTVMTCILVAIIQNTVWLFVTMLIGLVTILPSHYAWRSAVRSDDIEAYAAHHPWRIHLAATLFRWGCISQAVISWFIYLSVLYFLSGLNFMSGVNWQWVYIVSFLVFLSALNNARTLNSQANSLSFRLRGGSSELRYSHGKRDQPPDEILGPIVPERHGF